MLKALLVDFDGTLVDTQAANVAAYRAALAEAGRDVPEKALAAVVGALPWQAMLGAVAPDLTPEAAETIARRKRDIYPHFLRSVRVNVALTSLIGIMRQATKTALVTSASRQSVHAVLDAASLHTLFDLLICSDDCTRHKPDPEPFALAAARLEVVAAECLVFEDSDVGVAAARAFGAPVHVVHW